MCHTCTQMREFMSWCRRRRHRHRHRHTHARTAHTHMANTRGSGCIHLQLMHTAHKHTTELNGMHLARVWLSHCFVPVPFSVIALLLLLLFSLMATMMTALFFQLLRCILRWVKLRSSAAVENDGEIDKNQWNIFANGQALPNNSSLSLPWPGYGDRGEYDARNHFHFFDCLTALRLFIVIIVI